MSTPNEITTAALAKSRKNQPGVTASPAEAFAQFKRTYPVFWTIGARVNPGFFGAKELLANDNESDPAGWLRPSDAELVARLEIAGVELIVVPFDERDTDPLRPAVYEWGQEYFPAGNVNDPALDADITAWFSKKPDTPADGDEDLEDLWPDNFDELLVLELAIVLALKDDRDAEVGSLRVDRDIWLRRFVAHIEHQTISVVRSQGAAQRWQGPTFVPLNQLLAGGTEVDLA